jgi:FkbM family methyltransferase
VTDAAAAMADDVLGREAGMEMIRAWKSAVKRNLPEFARRRLELRDYRARMTASADGCIGLLADFVAGKTFIDVGANEGSFAFHLKNRASHVVAFEPIDHLADTIRRFNPTAEVHNCALSDRSGEETLYVPYLNGIPVLTRCSLNLEANPGFEIKQQSVRVRRLDDFRIENVGAIKIDVEGHEENVLRGAQDTLTANKPALLIEIEERYHPGRSWEVIADIMKLGYEGFYVNEENKLAAAGEFDFAAMQNPLNAKHPFRPANGRFLNNFLFAPQA